eukprot:TRINITY_DN14868_c0_g1_i1.p1 TRINITY_DN14868_c0_g1~~TRINITY_DN14868_c0_g1_i1.p1  ORF type:complete len:383 (-),score=32.27 TRINITY_DN14868_c0_g1_i1:140-1288(-)
MSSTDSQPTNSSGSSNSFSPISTSTEHRGSASHWDDSPEQTYTRTPTQTSTYSWWDPRRFYIDPSKEEAEIELNYIRTDHNRDQERNSTRGEEEEDEEERTEFRQVVEGHSTLVKLCGWVPCLTELKNRDLRQMLVRLITLSIMLLSGLWFMSATVIFAGMRAPTNVPDLPDLGFAVLPALDEEDLDIPNNLLIITGLFSVARFALHRRGFTILRRVAVLWLVLIMGRCTTLVATSYPDPSQSCKTYKSPDTILSFIIETVYRPEFITCGDLMYSGHTVYFSLMCLSWSYYRKYDFERLVWIPTTICILSLVATRLHYLNDVLIAFYFSVMTWYMYHIIATDSHTRKHSRLVSWLEKDIIIWEEQNPHEVQKDSLFCCFPAR